MEKSFCVLRVVLWWFWRSAEKLKRKLKRNWIERIRRRALRLKGRKWRNWFWIWDHFLEGNLIFLMVFLIHQIFGWIRMEKKRKADLLKLWELKNWENKACRSIYQFWKKIFHSMSVNFNLNKKTQNDSRVFQCTKQLIKLQQSSVNGIKSQASQILSKLSCYLTNFASDYKFLHSFSNWKTRKKLQNQQICFSKAFNLRKIARSSYKSHQISCKKRLK